MQGFRRNAVPFHFTAVSGAFCQKNGQQNSSAHGRYRQEHLRFSLTVVRFIREWMDSSERDGADPRDLQTVAMQHQSGREEGQPNRQFATSWLVMLRAGLFRPTLALSCVAMRSVV